MHVETTPEKITPAIRAFCEKLVPGGEPRFVPVMPLPWCVQQECFFNVDDVVRQHGGEPQHGWLIWEWPGIMLHAEFHCVWSTAEGLMDVTPLADGEPNILFLPHPTKTFDGNPVLSERKALVSDKVVRKFVHAHQEMERLRLSTLDGPVGRGAITFPMYRLSREDSETYEHLEAVATRLHKKMWQRGKRAARGRRKKR